MEHNVMRCLLLFYCFIVLAVNIVHTEHSVYVCKGSSITISCSGNTRIAVKQAIYGRLTANICVPSSGEPNVNCKTENSLDTTVETKSMYVYTTSSLVYTANLRFTKLFMWRVCHGHDSVDNWLFI